MSFDNVHLGAAGLRDAFAAGKYSALFLERYPASGAFRAAASLGIAEAAQSRIVTVLRGRVDSVVTDPHAVTELAGNVVELAGHHGGG